MRSRGLKTYSHLAEARQRPSEYEVATTRLHHHVERGLAVDAPVAQWYTRHQRGSRWRAANWGRFADPRETTYTKYTRLQRAKESFCDGLFASIDESDYDAALSPEAFELLARALPPMRFALHGFQMVAAYIGQMAPEGRITIAALLQGADELRRIQRIAYRMAQLRRRDGALGDDSRARFEREDAWQPLRQVVESLLVTWDWAEAFVALNLCVKPAIDELFMVELPALAKARGDYLLGQICASLGEDCLWQRQWTEALARIALEEEDNREPAREWAATWTPRAARALEPLGAMLAGPGGGEVDVPAVVRRSTAPARRLDLLPSGGAS
jgi:toluene monooxygenase system protein E